MFYDTLDIRLGSQEEITLTRDEYLHLRFYAHENDAWFGGMYRKHREKLNAHAQEKGKAYQRQGAIAARPVYLAAEWAVSLFGWAGV